MRVYRLLHVGIIQTRPDMNRSSVWLKISRIYQSIVFNCGYINGLLVIRVVYLSISFRLAPVLSSYSIVFAIVQVDITNVPQG